MLGLAFAVLNVCNPNALDIAYTDPSYSPGQLCRQAFPLV